MRIGEKRHLFFFLVSSPSKSSYMAWVACVAAVACVVFHAAVAWPGIGVVSIYYQTHWEYPITVHFVADGLPMRNQTMRRWWGPYREFESADWKYIELAANDVSELYFSNSSGAIDDRNGGFWEIEGPGVYAIYNDSTNVSLSYFWPGCPGVPPTNVVVQCSAHGVCDDATFECRCDEGWACPACECCQACNIVEAQRAEGLSNITYTSIYSAEECCTKCSELSTHCVAANYNYESFVCQILNRVDKVVNVSLTEPYGVVFSPIATPAPASSSAGSGDVGDGSTTDKTVFIVVGVGGAVLLVVGLVGVRIVTGQQKQEEMMRLLAASQAPASRRGVFEGKYRVVRQLGRGAFGVVYLVAKKRDAPNTPNSPTASGALAVTKHGGYGSSGSYVGRRTISPPQQQPSGALADPMLYTQSPKNSSLLQPAAPHGVGQPLISVTAVSGGGASAVTVAHSVNGPYSTSSPGLLANPHTDSLHSGSTRDLLFAMKVIHCTNEEDLALAFAEFQSLRRLQGHDNIIAVLDMFMTWEAELGAGGSSDYLAKMSSCRSLTDVGDDAAPLSHSVAEEDDAVNSVAPPTRYLCIVMEYMSEGTLEKAIREDPAHFSQPSVIVSMLRQILSGIAFSHKKNLIHRDLKPGNVLLSHGRTRAVLTDFGLARDLDASMTERGGGGTLHFLAPEQMDHRVSKKSDIWSIACIAVAMAHAQTSTSTRALFLLRSNATFEEDLRHDMHQLPLWLQDLLLRMLQVVPVDRPTADECIADIDAKHVPAFSRQVSETSIVLSPCLLPSPQPSVALHPDEDRV